MSELERPGERVTTPAVRKVLGVIALVLGIEAAAFGFLHRSDEEILRASEDPGDAGWMAALHIRSHRGNPTIWTRAQVDALLSSDDPRIRELALTHDFARGEGAAAQRAWASENRDDARGLLFYAHQKRTMKRAAIDAYFSAPSR